MSITKHRVVRTIDSGAVVFGIHEVQLRDDGSLIAIAPLSVTNRDAGSIDELHAMLDGMRDALHLPAISPADMQLLAA